MNTKEIETKNYPKRWTLVRLGEVANFKTGKLDSHYAEEYGKFPFFTCAPTPSRINLYAFDCEAVLLAGNNANGIFHLNYYNDKFNVYQRTYVITQKDNRLSLKYLYFRLYLTLNVLRDISQGTATKFLTMRILNNLEIVLPPLYEQEKIAEFLWNLQNKIELNHQMNKTLEAIGQAIFKHWFVDFEFPNEEGKPYKSSGGEMVFNDELGKEIPKGWEVGKIGEILKIQIGGDWGKDTEFENAVQANSLRGVDLEKIKLNGYSEEAPLRWVKKNSLEKRKLTDCDILIGGSGLGPIGRTIYFSKELIGLYERPITYSNFCKRLSAQTPSYAVYAEKVLEDMYISGEMKQYFTGTSIPNLDANSLLNHNIIISSKDVVNDFFKIAISKFSKLYNKENKILSQIRDSLLPKLMSGQIRVGG